MHRRAAGRKPAARLKLAENPQQCAHGRRPRGKSRCPGAGCLRDGRAALPGALGLGLRLLPASSPLTGGSRGRAPDHVPERLSEPEPGDAAEGRLRLAPPDRAERLLRPDALVGPPREARASPGHHDPRGDRCGTGALVRRPHRPYRRALQPAGAPARGDPPARMAGPLLPRGGTTARADPGRGRDADLPRAPLARRRPRRSGQARAPQGALRTGRGRARRGDQGALRREHGRQARHAHRRRRDHGNRRRHRPGRRVARQARPGRLPCNLGSAGASSRLDLVVGTDAVDRSSSGDRRLVARRRSYGRRDEATAEARGRSRLWAGDRRRREGQGQEAKQRGNGNGKALGHAKKAASTPGGPHGRTPPGHDKPAKAKKGHGPPSHAPAKGQAKKDS